MRGHWNQRFIYLSGLPNIWILATPLTLSFPGSALKNRFSDLTCSPPDDPVSTESACLVCFCCLECLGAGFGCFLTSGAIFCFFSESGSSKTSSSSNSEELLFSNFMLMMLAREVRSYDVTDPIDTDELRVNLNCKYDTYQKSITFLQWIIEKIWILVITLFSNAYFNQTRNIIIPKAQVTPNKMVQK